MPVQTTTQHAMPVTLAVTVPDWLLCALQAYVFTVSLSFVGEVRALSLLEHGLYHFAFCALWQGTFR